MFIICDFFEKRGDAQCGEFGVISAWAFGKLI